MATSEAPAVDNIEAEMDAIMALDLFASLRVMSQYEAELARLAHEPEQTQAAARLRLLMSIVYDHIEGLGV